MNPTPDLQPSSATPPTAPHPSSGGPGGGGGGGGASGNGHISGGGGGLAGGSDDDTVPANANAGSGSGSTNTGLILALAIAIPACILAAVIVGYYRQRDTAAPPDATDGGRNAPRPGGATRSNPMYQSSFKGGMHVNPQRDPASVAPV